MITLLIPLVLIKEKGYDPFDIESVMKANNIAYKPYSESSAKLNKSTPLSMATTSRRGASMESSSYQYQGENDPVHRPHHYQINDQGRKYRVYDDEH